MYYTFGLVSASKEKGKDDDIVKMSWERSIFYIVLGSVGLALGGNWIVGGATALADYFNWPEALVGVTIVAIGTSLPELATSVVAAMRKNADIAIGNVAGSNIFNVFWILGVSSMINPLPYNSAESDSTALVAILSAALLLIFLFLGKKHVLQRWQGGLFLACYFGYMIYLIT
jgi:cation:H+ antiporter